MRRFIGLTVAACVVMLATADVGKAQATTTITTSGFTTPPEISKPSGSYTTGGARIVGGYRILIDYGVYVNNVYTPLANFPAVPVGVFPNPLTGAGIWSIVGAGIPLNGNVAAGTITHIRARFQQDPGNNGNWVTIATHIRLI